jgi:hypothetical protein
LFYYAIVDFEVTDGSRVSFPTDASNYIKTWLLSRAYT